MNVSKFTSPRERRRIGENEFWMKGFVVLGEDGNIYRSIRYSFIEMGLSC